MKSFRVMNSKYPSANLLQVPSGTHWIILQNPAAPSGRWIVSSGILTVFSRAKSSNERLHFIRALYTRQFQCQNADFITSAIRSIFSQAWFFILFTLALSISLRCV